jgi:hypothetical protein
MACVWFATSKFDMKLKMGLLGNSSSKLEGPLPSSEALASEIRALDPFQIGAASGSSNADAAKTRPRVM